MPTDPTCAHWYDRARLTTLIAAEINKANRDHSPQRPVRDFIGDFRGLASTVKRSQICDALTSTRELLDAYLRRGDGAVIRLLSAMKEESKPVRARDLGVIGERHIRAKLATLGVGRASARYKCVGVDVEGVPYLIEVGFGHCPQANVRTMVAGLNWSASIGGDPFQDLGDGEGLVSVLAGLFAGPQDPVVLVLHVAGARLDFNDHDKSDVALPAEVQEKIVVAVKQVTATWTKQRRAEIRDRNALLRRHDAMNASAKPMTVKAAVYSVLAEAYAAASDNGAPPANGQIYYAARPEVLRLTGKDTLHAPYFTQTLLIDYINDPKHRAECTKWDIAFDARGHFAEPYTGHEVGLGTLEVR